MRTEENWEKIKKRYYPMFTPRIARDFELIQNLETYNNKGKSVFIHGAVRTGKTLIAANMMMDELKRIYLNAIPNAHNRTIFVSFPKMLEEIKMSFGEQGKTKEIIDKYLNAHFLVLDDFFTKRPSDWVMETIYHLINHRYENMLTTIITCNFSLDELSKLTGDLRISSRINDSYLIIEKQSFKLKK